MTKRGQLRDRRSQSRGPCKRGRSPPALLPRDAIEIQLLNPVPHAGALGRTHWKHLGSASSKELLRIRRLTD
eukprot:6211864-Pleurochrysis_carterae.AAC.2